MLCGDSVRQFSNMLPSFLNLNALPVPLLRQFFVLAHFICVLSIKPHLDHAIKVPLPEQLKMEPKWSPNGVQMEPKLSPNDLKLNLLEPKINEN